METIRKIVSKNFEAEIPEDLGFEVRNEKIYFFKKHLSEIYDFLRVKGIRLEKLGIYFGKLKKNDKIQLSLEGSQIVGKTAKKNVLKINDYEELLKFLKGEISIKNFENVEKHNFPIIRYKNYFVGSAASSESEIRALFPKNPRKILFE